MLIGKKTENQPPSTTAFNVIGEGTRIVGDINSTGDLRVDGIIEGTVNTKAKFVLGNSGKVVGNIISRNADISGEIKGNIRVSELTFVKTSAKINGDIETNKLVVESGGEFNGKCIMGKTIKLGEINHERIPQPAAEQVLENQS
jgi:cytoskeletal protein CcmA (bactofilin family)